MSVRGVAGDTFESSRVVLGLEILGLSRSQDFGGRI